MEYRWVLTIEASDGYGGANVDAVFRDLYGATQRIRDDVIADAKLDPEDYREWLNDNNYQANLHPFQEYIDDLLAILDPKLNLVIRDRQADPDHYYGATIAASGSWYILSYVPYY